MKDGAATIVVIDDKLDDISAVIELMRDAGLRVEPCEPEEVTADGLAAADLVLVDWDLREWGVVRDAARPPATSPRDGLALTEVLRSNISPDHHGPPTAFALHSGELAKLGHDLPGPIVEHALARVHNLEWVFEKTSEKTADATVVDRFAELASVVHTLPHPWPGAGPASEAVLAGLLGVPLDDEQTWQTVIDCHPPIYELGANSKGLTVLRWLAQRVLPYPSFLLDDTYLAVRLGVADHASIDATGIAELMSSAQYRGALSGFLGRRWWRARVDDVLWEITEGRSASPGAVRQAVGERAHDVELLEIANPVVCVGADYRVSQVVDADEAVRLTLDDWPPFAQEPWAPVALAREEEAIHVRVVPQDRDRLEQ